MATRDNHRQGPPKPLHAGDMDAVFSEIEKDALPRPTITAVLILDRAPNREVLMDRLERASRTLLPFRYRLILQLREDMRLPSAAVLDPMLNALGPAVVPFFGMMLKHCDFAVSNIPVGDQPRYLAGAKIVGLYPFGPLVGTAANCTLVGYEDKAFVAINADAAAIPDLDMLGGCIREGFDAVIALDDVS